MPPLRPLPDLCLITLFKMMPPNEQMVASQMSPRCAGLVRAANRTVKSLVITDRNVEDPCDLKNLKDRINSYSLASKPAMQPLMDIPGEPSFPDYPLTTRLSKWNCLHIDLTEQIGTATIEQIVNIFSAVTDLKLITNYSERLVRLLQHPKWQCQLTNLMVNWIESEQDLELITAINGLPALQCLVLDSYGDIDLPDLPILAQLKVVVFESDDLQAFVRSLEQYATDNADLQVHLLSGDIDALLSLSQPLHSRFVRFGLIDLFCFGNRMHLFSQFRSLTSLFICGVGVTDVAPLFTSLSQLHQLVHLRLGVNFWGGEEVPPPARSLAQLNSLRALELRLTIFSHSQVQWLNLPVTMPNLYSIYIEEFYCRGCGVQIGRYINRNSSPFNSSRAQNCLHSSLFALHSGVPLNRLILKLKEECISVEKLLLQSASEPSVSTGQR